ncbi:collagen alpha-1(I) chain-like [Bos javanicus]|uniref:collagen alpha-1(I) chain-like n=1 Tax=Bos javanicus TaxID=9906 RepID=UPI002AA6AA0D|nr:collagen alpha-1(I) chain-like [Bos javanicus]
MTDEGSPQEPSSPAFQMRLPSLPAWWVPLQSSGSEDTGSSSSEKSTQESRHMPWLQPWGRVASSAKPALETRRETPATAGVRPPPCHFARRGTPGKRRSRTRRGPQLRAAPPARARVRPPGGARRGCSAPGSHLKFSARRPRRGVGRAAARVPRRPAGPGEDATRGWKPPAPPPGAAGQLRPPGPARLQHPDRGPPACASRSPPGSECAGSAARPPPREGGSGAGGGPEGGAGRGAGSAGGGGERGGHAAPARGVRAAQRRASALGCSARRRAPSKPPPGPPAPSARPPPSPPFPASPASPPSGSQRSAALGLQVPRGAPACWGHVLPGPRRSRTPRALPGAPTCHVKRSRSAAPGRTPRGPGLVSFPGGPGEPLPLGASCRRGAGTAGARRRQLPRTARAMPGAFPSKSQSPRGPAARTPGRRGALGLGPAVLSRLRATPRLGMDTYAGVEWILQFFCSKCVLIQSVAFTNGTRKVLEVGRAVPLMGTV